MHFVVLVDFTRSIKLGKTQSWDVILAMTGIFSRFRIPNVVISEYSPQFVSGEFKELSKTYQFVHGRSSRRHPQRDRLAERTAGTVKALFKKAWQAGDNLQLGLLAYRELSMNLLVCHLVSYYEMGRKLRRTKSAIATQLVP